MPRIRICRVDQSLYGTVVLFSEHLLEAFGQIGCDVDWYEGGEADLIISLATLPDIETESRELLLLLDHPFRLDDWTTAHLDDPDPGLIVSCIDHTHIEALHTFFWPERPAFFLPHAGSVGPTSGERPYDICLSATYMAAHSHEAQIEKLPTNLQKLTKRALDAAFASDWMSFEDAARLSASKWMKIGHESSYILRVVFNIWDQVIRTARRLQVLEVLADAGIALDIAGGGWEHYPRISDHHYLGQLTYDQVLERYGQSKIVLNTGANFPNGSHERVFSGQLAGAAVVTERNAYWEKLYTDEVATYRFTQLDELPRIVTHLLENPAEREAMALRGQRAAKRDHTWAQRAQEILKVLGGLPAR